MKPIFLTLSLLFLFSCSNDAETKGSTENKGPKDALIEDMNNTSKTPPENPYRNSKIEVKVYDNKKSGNSVSGFGYDIVIDSVIYVHQPHIPAVAGNNGFTTEEKARKAGELVAYKIKNNILPPSVTVEELDSIGVLK